MENKVENRLLFLLNFVCTFEINNIFNTLIKGYFMKKTMYALAFLAAFGVMLKGSVGDNNDGPSAGLLGNGDNPTFLQNLAALYHPQGCAFNFDRNIYGQSAMKAALYSGTVAVLACLNQLAQGKGRSALDTLYYASKDDAGRRTFGITPLAGIRFGAAEEGGLIKCKRQDDSLYGKTFGRQVKLNTPVVGVQASAGALGVFGAVLVGLFAAKR